MVKSDTVSAGTASSRPTRAAVRHRVADTGRRSFPEVALLVQGDDNYGVGRVAREIAALVPGIRCVAFCRGPEYDDIVAGGVPVHVLPGGEYFRGFYPRSGFITALRQMVRARRHWRRCARELDAWCRRENVRVLHGNVWAHYLTLKSLRRAHPGEYRTIWHVHNFLNLERHAGLPGRFNLWQAQRGADWILGVSRAVAAGWGKSGVPTRVVYNGIENADPTSMAPLFSRRAPERPLRLVGAGRMDWFKGHHVAIAALARLRDRGVSATLDLFGGPLAGNEYHEALRRQVRELELDACVTFHGYVDDLAHRLPAYHVALQTRIDPEPFGLFIAECMSRGVPVVASANGGVPELIRGGVEGILYPPGDSGQLAHSIEGLIEHPWRTDALVKAARERVCARFGRERFAADMAAFYAEVLADPHAKSPLRAAVHRVEENNRQRRGEAA